MTDAGSSSTLLYLATFLVFVYFIYRFLISITSKTHERVNAIDINTLNDINNLNGRDFEIFLGDLFRKMGHYVEVTQSTRDHGADLILSKNGRRIAVQAKRYQGTVPNAAVQQCYYAMSHYECEKGMVVTNSAFSDHAKEEASRVNIKLVEGLELIQWIKTYMPEILNKTNTTSSSNLNKTDNIVSETNRTMNDINTIQPINTGSRNNLAAIDVPIMPISYDREDSIIRQETEILLNADIGDIVDASVSMPQENSYDAIITFNSPTLQNIRNIIDLAAILYFNTYYHYRNPNLRKGNIYVNNDRQKLIAAATLYGKWIQPTDFSIDGKLTGSAKQRLLREVYDVTHIFEN